MNGRDRSIGRDPMAAIPVHRPDDRFVPLRSQDLAEYLSRDTATFGAVAGELPAVCESITDVIQQEAIAFDRELVHRYVPFNPDAETIVDPADTRRRTEDSCGEFISRIEFLLEKTNFVELSTAQIEEACRAPRSEKLRVRLHPDRVRHISVWVRGRGDVPRKRRNWRGVEEQNGQRVPVHRRLVLVFRFPNDPYVYLKVFKEIPTDEVDALLPHAEVLMTAWDRLMVAGGGVGVVGSTFSKIMAAVKAVAYWSNLAWVLLVGGLVISWRAFRGFRNAKTKRNWLLTRRLYYQNLDNNVGVIHKLLAMVAQEEVKEALLAYAFCSSARPHFRCAEDLRAAVEDYLQRHFHVEVDFDVLDSIETLRRLRLWNEAGALHPLEPRAALAELQAHWMEKRTIRHYDETVSRRIAARSAARDAQ